MFDHERGVQEVVAALRACELPCILVDDGSGQRCAALLDELAAADEQLVLLRLPRNRGKGAAVCAGLRRAALDGYTHALQIDADGQHALRDIPGFIAVSAADPGAVICGRPLFGPEMPRSRRLGRYLTHVWVWINTLSFDIPDAMCGFRVYPVAAVVDEIGRGGIGARMSFDIDLLVRLHWRGMAMRWIDTAVTYPAGGISHFRLWTDNLLITRAHTLLFFGMLLRLPRLLARKIHNRGR